MREVEVGKIYRHFKGDLCIVLDIVLDSEAYNEQNPGKVVVYRKLSENRTTWARPYDMFNSEVDHDKYPDVEQEYRFEEFTKELAIKLVKEGKL